MKKGPECERVQGWDAKATLPLIVEALERIAEGGK